VAPVWLLGTVKGFARTASGVSAGALSWFFFKAGAFTFGSGLAAVPFLHSGLVEQHHWLTEQQFLDAVAMGLISPGPVVIMASFAGYLAFGLTGAIIATVCVFLPALLLVVIPGPQIRRHEQHPRLQGFVTGATAAAAGAIAGAAISIGQNVIDRTSAAVIALAALAALLQPWRKVPEPLLVAVAAAVGVVALR
jgi:chromate transporter